MAGERALLVEEGLDVRAQGIVEPTPEESRPLQRHGHEGTGSGPDEGRETFHSQDGVGQGAQAAGGRPRGEEETPEDIPVPAEPDEVTLGGSAAGRHGHEPPRSHGNRRGQARDRR
jgi:hypothetical protein